MRSGFEPSFADWKSIGRYSWRRREGSVSRTVMTTRAVPLVGGWEVRIRVEEDGEASVDVLELISPTGTAQIVAADTALD
jgi:hypothetical protein